MTLATVLLLVLVTVLVILLAARAVEAASTRIEQATADLNEVDAAYDARQYAQAPNVVPITSAADFERNRFACAMGAPHPSAEL